MQLETPMNVVPRSAGGTGATIGTLKVHQARSIKLAPITEPEHPPFLIF